MLFLVSPVRCNARSGVGRYHYDERCDVPGVALHDHISDQGFHVAIGVRSKKREKNGKFIAIDYSTG